MPREVVGSIAKMLARAGPIIRRLPAGRPIMIEVGVSSGIMAEHLLRTRRDLTWHGVDPWAGSSEQRRCYIDSLDTHASLSALDAEHHMGIALQRLEPFGVRATVHRDWSPEAAEGFARGWADMVFLDGDHSLEGVRADLPAWFPVVRPGGWLGGHDYDHPESRFRFGVKQAVDEWVAREEHRLQLDDGMTWWVRKP